MKYLYILVGYLYIQNINTDVWIYKTVGQFFQVREEQL